MTEYAQLPLPGTGIRIIVAATWFDPDRPCKVSISVDLPTEDLTTQLLMSDTTGVMTLDECTAAMETLMYWAETHLLELGLASPGC